MRDGDYEKLAITVDDELRCKAYYPLVHTLQGFGSDFAFHARDLATIASATKIFKSFLAMSKSLCSWGQDGVLTLHHDGQREQVRMDAGEFKHSISAIRFEVSFLLTVPARFDSKAILSSMESLLRNDLGLFFGLNSTEQLISMLHHVRVDDWLREVSYMRTALQPGGDLACHEDKQWRIITTRGKQQAECLMSLLGYCSIRVNRALRSRRWAIVWAESADKEYPGARGEKSEQTLTCTDRDWGDLGQRVGLERSRSCHQTR
jgi:hypothetical protein